MRISSFFRSIWILFCPSISSLFRKLLKHFMSCCHIKIMSKISFQQWCIYSNISWAAVILKSWARCQCSSGLYYSIFFAFASSNCFLDQLLSFFPIILLYSFQAAQVQAAHFVISKVYKGRFSSEFTFWCYDKSGC